MKKLLGVVLLVVALIVLFVYVKINKPYSNIINMNWSIKLPKSYKEIYSKDSGASFHGDGDRYHIFQYTNDNDIIQALSLENSKNETIELKSLLVQNLLILHHNIHNKVVPFLIYN